MPWQDKIFPLRRQGTTRRGRIITTTTTKPIQDIQETTRRDILTGVSLLPGHVPSDLIFLFWLNLSFFWRRSQVKIWLGFSTKRIFFLTRSWKKIEILTTKRWRGGEFQKDFWKKKIHWSLLIGVFWLKSFDFEGLSLSIRICLSVFVILSFAFACAFAFALSHFRGRSPRSLSQSLALTLTMTHPNTNPRPNPNPNPNS